MKESFIQKLLPYLLGGILLAIIVPYINDYMSSPETTLIAKSYQQKVCPISFNFQSNNEKEAPFTITIKNIGSNGILYTNLRSDMLLSKKSTEGSFQNNYTISWSIDEGQSQDFEFKIKLRNESYSENITANITYGCYEEIAGFISHCKERKWICEYAKDYAGYILLKEY
jgi:hypothetical protein